MPKPLENPSLLEVSADDSGRDTEKWGFLDGTIVEVHPIKVGATPGFHEAGNAYSTEDTMRLLGFSENVITDYRKGWNPTPPVIKGEN